MLVLQRFRRMFHFCRQVRFFPLAIFVVLLLFHVTPSFYAICHTIVHERGIAHSHGEIGKSHFNRNHSHGGSHNHFFEVVSVILQSGSQSFFKTHFTSACIIPGSGVGIFSQLEPPQLSFYHIMAMKPPPSPLEFRFSNSNRAPPAA